jgi:hypothetical protein
MFNPSGPLNLHFSNPNPFPVRTFRPAISVSFHFPAVSSPHGPARGPHSRPGTSLRLIHGCLPALQSSVRDMQPVLFPVRGAVSIGRRCHRSVSREPVDLTNYSLMVTGTLSSREKGSSCSGRAKGVDDAAERCRESEGVPQFSPVSLRGVHPRQTTWQSRGGGGQHKTVRLPGLLASGRENGLE